MKKKFIVSIYIQKNRVYMDAECKNDITDCLYEKGIDTIIKIRQMKTHTYEKPISAELVALIRKAIACTQEQYGKTKYIFVFHWCDK